MNRPFNPALGYRRFDELAQVVRAWAHSVSPQVLGYAGAHVADRLTQRLVAAGLSPFMQLAAQRLAREEDPLQSGVPRVECGVLAIDASSGRVTLSRRLFVSALTESLAHWVHASLAMIRALASARRIPSVPVTVVAGLSNEMMFVDGSDAGFAAFTRDNAITPLREAGFLVVQAIGRKVSAQPRRIAYYRHPILGLLSAQPVSVRELLALFAGHVAAMAAFVWLVLRVPAACLLGRDFAYHAAACHVNRKGIVEAYVITNSLTLNQPLWLRALPGRRFSTHMIWYSQNSIPFAYKVDNVRSHEPVINHIAVDQTWVWTKGFKEFLRSAGVRGAIHAVGPIICYLPELHPGNQRSSALRVAIFDVTPQTDTAARALGLTYNYYRQETALRFINGILAVRERTERALGRKIELVLKHKRQPGKVHEQSYLSFIDELGTADRLTIVTPQTNIFTLVGGSDAVVVIPFSSPVHIAAARNIPAVFFDPTGEIVRTHENDPGVDFVSGEDELYAWLWAALASAGRATANA